jgi:biotin-(acetyl-CoA carboxylase) ligase
LLSEFESDYNRFLREGAPSITGRFTKASSYAIGKKVRVANGGDSFTGVTAGLAPEGLLQVEREDGKMVTVIAGDVMETK